MADGDVRRRLLGKMLTPEEWSIIEAIRADPLQHEHVVSIEADRWSWTLQHPILERAKGALFDCQVGEHLSHWLREGPPGTLAVGRYVVDDSEWIEYPSKALTLIAVKDWT